MESNQQIGESAILRYTQISGSCYSVMEMFKKVFYNTGAQIIGKVITASTTLSVTLLIARSLGVQGYGEFTKIFVFVGYFYTLSDFGVNAIFIKIAPSNLYPLLRSLVGLRTILAILWVAIVNLIVFFLPYNQALGTGFAPIVKVGIVIASLTILTQALFTSANAFFQKILRYDLSTIAAILGSVVILLATIFVTLTKPHLLGYVTSYVAGGVTFVVAAYWLIFKRTNQLILPQFSPHEFLKLIRLAWPIGAALIFNLIYFRIDVFILANFRSSSEVGVYGLAYQFFEAALSIPIFFANALYPILTQLHATNFSEFKKQVKNWIKILTAVGLLLCLILLLVALLIPPVFSQDFSGSVLALQILSLGMPFFFLSALLWHLTIIDGHQKSLVVIYAAGAAFNLLANLLFIPRFGYLAAAVITVVSEAIIFLLLVRATNILKYRQ